MQPFFPFIYEKEKKEQEFDQLTLTIEEPYVEHTYEEKEPEYQVIIIDLM